MKGGWRLQPLQHLGVEKSSQTNEEKNRSTTLGLSRHGGEELELAGVALVNGSGGRRKKEVRALYWPRPLVCDAAGFQLALLVLMTESTKSNTVDSGQTLVNLGHHLENLINNH
jgi:hypothetical protein